MERESTFMERKTQYGQDISSQRNPQIQCSPNKKSQQVIVSECQEIDSQTNMERREKTQNSQGNTEGEGPSWRTDATRLQDLL